MPSRDGTGKRLSGAAQKRQAEERARARWGLPPVDAPAPENPLREVAPPPVAEGVEAVLAWAQALQAQAAAAARRGQDLARVRTVTRAVKKLGQLGQKALRSEMAVAARKAYEGRGAEVLGEDPPSGDSVAVPAWAFLLLARVVHQLATMDPFDGAQLADATEALAVVGYVPPSAEIDRLIERLEDPAGRC